MPWKIGFSMIFWAKANSSAARHTQAKVLHYIPRLQIPGWTASFAFNIWYTWYSVDAIGIGLFMTFVVKYFDMLTFFLGSVLLSFCRTKIVHSK